MLSLMRRLFRRAPERARETAPLALPAVERQPLAPPPAPLVPPPVQAYEPEPARAEPVQLQLLLPGEDEDFGMVRSLRNPYAYMIGLVGEQHYQYAVSELEVGAGITLELEPDNPHDNAAIAAVDGKGRVIGYIATDSWLRDAIFGEGASFSARVLAAEMGSQGFIEVVLEVEPNEEPLGERRYRV